MGLNMIDLNLLKRDLLRSQRWWLERHPQTKQTGRRTVWLNTYTSFALQLFAASVASSGNFQFDASAVEFARRYFRGDPNWFFHKFRVLQLHLTGLKISDRANYKWRS
jgi:hypothetical protein